MIGAKSLKRALDILNLFTPDNFECSVTDVAHNLIMNKSTASRLMANLELAGYLRKSSESRKYRLGKRVAELASVYYKSIDINAIVMPYLREMNKEINEFVSVHAIEGDLRYHLAWVESSQPVRRVIDPKDTYGPLHAGAPGKLLLAYQPEYRINEILGRTGMTRYTKLTITDKAELFKELARIREAGLAISKGEHIELLSTVAAPIINYLNQVIAALSISWITRSDDSVIEKKYSGLVKDNSKKISRELGYQGN